MATHGESQLDMAVDCDTEPPHMSLLQVPNERLNWTFETVALFAEGAMLGNVSGW